MSKDTVPTASRPSQGGSEIQKICTECGTVFSASNDMAKTCGPAHRKRRGRRIAAEKAATGTFTEFAVDVSGTLSAMEVARDAAIDDLPAVARGVLAEEVRPYVREALTVGVLQSIGGLMELLPLAQESLRQDLLAYRPLLDPETGVHMRGPDGEPEWEVDTERRAKAQALVLKYTVGQAGLAPQPDAPEAGGVTVVFGGMPEPVVNATVVEEHKLAELESGEARQCDICEEVKPRAEFVAGSSRCTECQAALRARIDAQVAEMEGRAGG